MRPLLMTIALMVLATACGEPPIAIDIPERDGRQVLDLDGLLEVELIEPRLAGYAAEGVDIVALVYTTPDASCGEAFRAGQQFVEAWQADVALVAVAEPGGFHDLDAERCVGLQPLNTFDVGRGTREEISEVIWPDLIDDNAWDEVFLIGAEELYQALAGEGTEQ